MTPVIKLQKDQICFANSIEEEKNQVTQEDDDDDKGVDDYNEMEELFELNISPAAKE